MTSQEKIREFWTWFATSAPHFGDSYQNEDLLAQLDSRVTSLGDFAWEVGPGRTAENAFVLSPGGDRALLAEARAIVGAAPSLPGWEFHSAKPPKDWKPRFEIQDANGQPFEIDASSWRCVLLRHPDGVHEALVEASNLDSLPNDYRRWAAEITLDGLVGERRRLEIIDEVTVLEKFDRRESEAAFPIVEVRDRIGL